MAKALTFKQGLNYPWAKPIRLWYALWLLVPIFGWFALAGYSIEIIRNLVKGKIKEVPEFGSVWDNFVTGIVVALKFLPLLLIILIISSILEATPLIGWLLNIAFTVLQALLVPWLFINLVMTGKIEESLNVKKAWKIIYGNLREYVIVILKSIGVGLIYAVLMIVLIGIPCGMYSKHYFICDFYRRNR